MRSEKKVKNISQDDLGNKMGRVHVPAQGDQEDSDQEGEGPEGVQGGEEEQIQKKDKAESARQNAVEKVFGGDDE